MRNKIFFLLLMSLILLFSLFVPIVIAAPEIDLSISHPNNNQVISSREYQVKWNWNRNFVPKDAKIQMFRVLYDETDVVAEIFDVEHVDRIFLHSGRNGEHSLMIQAIGSDSAVLATSNKISFTVQRSLEAAENVDLILTTERGLDPVEVKIFLASLRATGCKCQVTMFTTNKTRAEFIELADTFGMEMIEYHFDTLFDADGPMNLHRFRLFRDYLRSRGVFSIPPQNAKAGKYRTVSNLRSVFMSDTRDVVFQADPFAALAPEQGVGFAVEPARLPIGKCDIHVFWLHDNCTAYAQESPPVIQRLKDESRSCAGTTIGAADGIATYCAMMLHEAKRTSQQDPMVPGRLMYCNDQAIHNYLLWTRKFEKRFPVTHHRHETSLLYTIGTVLSYKTNEYGEIMTDEDQVAAVVHQYDRIYPIRHFLKDMYAPDQKFIVDNPWGPAENEK